MSDVIRKGAWAGARILRRVARVLERAADAQALAIAEGMSGHDMEAHPDERYYAEQYWRWLEPELARLPAQPRVLDIGCGQGRLSLRVAHALSEAHVVGIDLTAATIDAARAKAAGRGLANVEFHAGDARTFVAGLGPSSCDLAIMTEVSFFMPRFREVVAAAARVLKPGGIFFGSFRSQYYNALHSVRDRDWRSAQLVADVREGEWGGGATWFTWQTADEVRALVAEAGLVAAGPLRGIGVLSGIEGDPLAAIAQPSKLDAAERARLLELELSFSEGYAACGRYILAVATKPSEEAITK
jgi:SAM-dependent methyltransferase